MVQHIHDTVVWMMMAACVVMGRTTSVWQHDAYYMPLWVANPMVLMMAMGDG
jgi:hypothetical protein